MTVNNKESLRIALIYALFGLLWILFSDRLLEALVSDPVRVNALQTWKGWAFILVTAVLVFVLARSFHRRVARAEGRLVESERRLSTFLDATSEAVYVIDRQGCCTYANAAAARTLGFEHPGALLGADMHALVHHSHSDGTPFPLSECHIHQAVDQGVSSRVEHEVFWRADGSAFPVEYRCDPLSRRGDPAGAVVIFSDISQRRRVEQTLRQLQRLEAVGELTGGIAHHVNNMLTVILGNVRLAQSGMPADSPARARLDSAVNAARRGGEQVKRLLAFSRRQVLTPCVIDVADLLNQCEPLLAGALKKGIRLDVGKGADVWPVRMDPEQLTTALINIVRNARDAVGNAGMIAIDVDNVSLDDDFVAGHPGASRGEFVRISLSDDGAGMPADVAERAFEPFFTTKEGGQAAGLGLSMVYGFIRQSGGYVSIESAEGAGTTVRLYLPRWLGADDPLPDEEAEEPPLPRGRETVLVVEDEAEVRDVTAAQIEALGYRVLQAGDGAQALALLARGTAIDLLFTDVVMPGGMDGLELVKAARRRNPGLRVLYSSGYATHALAGALDMRGSIALLDKPYTGETLARRIRAALDEPDAVRIDRESGD